MYKYSAEVLGRLTSKVHIYLEELIENNVLDTSIESLYHNTNNLENLNTIDITLNYYGRPIRNPKWLKDIAFSFNMLVRKKMVS